MAHVYQEDGIVAFVSMSNSNVDLMRHDLLERYGKPSSSMLFGDQLLWSGNDISIVFNEIKNDGQTVGVVQASWEHLKKAPAHNNQF